MNLDTLTDEEIKQLYHGILAMRQTKAGRALIDQSIEEIRSGKFQSQLHPTPVKATERFVEALEEDPDSFLDR
jgi:hypothetical protein